MPLALISVHDKSGLAPFARGLVALGYQLVASGGTARAISEAGLAVLAVEDLTGFPELLGGRVKTLHPAVHAGILSRRTEADAADLARHGIGVIDLVAVTLYPFEQALATNADDATLIEEIDIGGVTLLRAAAKNFAHVTVVPGPEHYDAVLTALGREPAELLSFRRQLAAIAFAETSSYDQTIAAWMANTDRAIVATELGGPASGQRPSVDNQLRYGENPHQSATFVPASGPAPYVQHAGKELSYNNLLDLDAAWCAVADLAYDSPDQAHAVVVKHGSPSGVARTPTAPEAVANAIAADPISAFGGIVALDRSLDLATAVALGDLFLEVIAAPSVADDALAHLRAKKKNCRVLTLALTVGRDQRPRARTVLGGTLTQSPDLALADVGGWTSVSRRSPDALTTNVLAFAWIVAKHVKSNAIVLATAASTEPTHLVTIGIGGGQTNRIDAVRQACERAGPKAEGAVLASDAFFPFADGLELAATFGVAAVAEPGGALRDADVISAADRLGLALVFTHRRHFRH